ncbi:MAG TPA: hypothetical protein VFI64_04170 [Nitrososphaeraceae archaeon]|nr:hypothetical protein [Nitrososphaeraceae archaeon]
MFERKVEDIPNYPNYYSVPGAMVGAKKDFFAFNPAFYKPQQFLYRHLRSQHSSSVFAELFGRADLISQ